jgi:integrase
MASIRENNGKLFFDFRYQGKRCREYTTLPDTTENRRKMAAVLKKITSAIELSTFKYREYFPQSKIAEVFEQGACITAACQQSATAAPQPTVVSASPDFESFAEQWFSESAIAWRRSYKATVRQILESRLIPEFGELRVSGIRREQLLAFRAKLATAKGRRNAVLSPRRVNAIMLVLSQVMNEAADRFGFVTPTQRIKPLKCKKADIKPFSLEEVRMIIENVRPDFRNYYTVRFYTGLRTGEIDGLKWKYVDFERRLILIRETFTWKEEDYTKNDASQRDVQMSAPVYDALKAQHLATGKKSEFVFCNLDGKPLDVNNVAKRVWYPLLRYLNLEPRNPYQSRHTAATLWLAAGENPQWISRQLGHASSEMLFKVYARFVPNLTRQDGSAFERLLMQGAPYPARAQAETTPPGAHQ